MSIRNTFLKAGVVLPLMITSFFLSSCKKEYPDYPYNEITSFEVKIAEENILKAVLEGNEIILYWPPFQTMPDSIAPEISVSDRAAISPASGAMIPFSDGFTYNVTAQDGSVQSFKLKISANTPDPGFYLRTDATNGVYNLNIEGSFNQICGNYIIPDTFATKVYFFNAKAGEVNVTKYISSLAQIRIQINIPSTIDTGYYNFRVISGKYSFEPEEKLRIYYYDPGITWPYTTELKTGNSTILNTGIGVHAEGPTRIKKVRLRSATDSSLHELELVSVEEGKITVKIPDQFPTGIYNGIELTSPAFPNGFMNNILNARRRFVVSN